MTNWHVCKYSTLMALQDDAPKNNLWRLTALINLRTSCSAATLNKSKGHAIRPPFKLPQSNHNVKGNHGRSGSFGGNANKGDFGSKVVWGRIKEVKQSLKAIMDLAILTTLET